VHDSNLAKSELLTLAYQIVARSGLDKFSQKILDFGETPCNFLAQNYS